MLMESFEVENFRSLKHLKLEKLARVNLLVGKNNSGKTSALEALWTIMGLENSDWLSIIEQERGLKGSKSDLRYLFYGFDSNISINLLATYRNNREVESSSVTTSLNANLRLQDRPTSRDPEFDFQNTGPVLSRKASSLLIEIRTPNLAEPLIFEFNRTERGSNRSQPISAGAEVFLKNGVDFPAASRNNSSEILTTNIDRQTLSTKLEELKFNKKDASLLQTMRLIDPRIANIDLGAGGQVYLDLGEKFRTLLPLNLMGEGIQRLLDIISAMVSTAGGIVIIDEIDNGLHYSALRILWKGILQAAREYDVQIFATTHSAEALRHLTAVLEDEENADYRDDIAAYTLIRAKDDTVRSYRYDYEQLDFAMEHDMEVRN